MCDERNERSDERFFMAAASGTMSVAKRWAKSGESEQKDRAMQYTSVASLRPSVRSSHD